MQELKEYSRSKLEDVKLEANESDIHSWRALLTVSPFASSMPSSHFKSAAQVSVTLVAIRIIDGLQGPANTPYQGGFFELDIKVPDQYPLVPPIVFFRTKIFHPNVHFKTGEICLDILKTAWSPAWTLQSTCQVRLPAPDTLCQLHIKQD